MNDNFTNTMLLIRYMDKELSETEQESLEKDLAENRALKDELDNLQYTCLFVSSYGLRKQVAGIHKQLKEEGELKAGPAGIIRSMARYSLRIAAAIVVLIMAGATYLYLTISPVKLYNENYSAYTIGSVRSADDLSPIEKAFREKDFKGVITIFNSKAVPDPKDYFLAGNAFLEMGEVPNAILQFNNNIEKNRAFQTSVYQEDAEYYLAAAYLKNKEANKALVLFEKINAQPLHLYHDKVTNWFIRKVKVAAWKQ